MSNEEVVAIDGKTLCGSHNKAQAQDAIEIVSGWVASQRLTIGQTKVAENSNEITAVPEVLSKLYIGRD